MYTIDATLIIAIALVSLVLIFIRISWTLKEICEAIESGKSPVASSANPVKTTGAIVEAAGAKAAAPIHDGPDDVELVAVIAVAHAAFREAV